MNTTPDDVAAAIDGLYAAFAAIPKPARIDGCPCCITPEEGALLLHKPLREITGNELSSYASSAFLTVGGVADYHYLLPRTLELTATDPDWWPSFEVTGRALRSAEPATWPEPLRRSLEAYLDAVVDAEIRAGMQGCVDEWLLGIGRIGYDVGPYLDRIAASREAILAYFESNMLALPSGRLGNPFWDPPDPAYDRILAWFARPDIARVIAEAYTDWP